eukprot:164657_1
MKRSPTIRYGLSEMEDHIDAHAYAQPMFHTTHTSDDIHPDSMVDDNENTYGVMSSYHKYHEAPSSMSMNKPSAIDTTRVSFEKMDVGYVQTLSPALSKHKSGLSFIIGGDSDAKEDNGLAQQLMLRRSPTVRHGLAQFGAGYPSTNLQSHLASDYDNDIDDLYELDPPLTRNAKICEFVDQNRSYITAHKAMCYVQRTKHKSSNLELILNGDNHRRNTMNTLNELAQKQDKYKQNVFIRVYIAGPTTETSVLLNIDSVASRTVRDLFTILNRKRTRDRFNAQYFDFYYKNKTKELGAIANGVSVMDLVQNDLIVLPKILSSDMNAMGLPIGLPQSKSDIDIGGHNLEPEELDDDDDKLFVNSLRRDVRAATTARPDSAAPSPAPSPRNSPTQNANSPMGSAADEFELNIADAVDDELLNVNVIPPPRDQVQLNRQKDKDIELLKTQIDGKAQLVRDLKQNVQELTENRRRELMHFQGSLETMKSRCREWYEQLMARVREMELTYQDRVNEEVERRAVELHRELADERRRMRDEFEKQLAAQQQTTADLSSNPHEIDELSREIARLNEELEKFKGKYFDSEQQKIELADALDELKEEKFKMEEKLEELAAKVAIEPFANEELLLQSRNEARSHHAKSTGEWNDLVQKLREEKENQEAQYEEEFREFERMANEKVVQLEEYYVQQLQMKEVQVQQLQQLQQQQMLAKQQQPLQNEQVTLLTQEKTQLTQQMSAASSEIAKLNYQHKHDKEQLVHAKKRNESNESKISAYNASFIELAEKLKQLNDDTKGLRKEKDKKQRKCDKLEKQKKKLKQQIKQLNEKIDNITAVTKELVNLKHKTIRQTEQWDKERSAHEQQMNRIKQQMMQNASKKIESINKYNVEMNNLRSNIKTLQSRCVRAEAENEKLREPNESQSMLGSAAQWVPTNWWQTKKH